MDDARNVVVVSDLHLSAGFDERTGTFSRQEDFFYDGAFARFLDHLKERAERERRRWRLLILGDLFDFLQVDLEGADPTDTSTEVTLRKLELIARGHRTFFAALGGFAAAGFPVEIVPGNHDVELLRPAVQARFVELLREAAGHATDAAITFHPWIYYEPGVIYAEHGHQYDEVNSFLTPLRPFVGPDGDQIDLPLGSYFVVYLFNRIEALDPFADNVRPMTSYMLWALQTHPLRTLGTVGVHLRLLMTVLAGSRELSAADRDAIREQYRREVLRPYAETVGLPYGTLSAIDDLAAVPATANKHRELRAMLLQPLVRVLPFLAALVAIYAAVGRVRRSFFLFASGVLGLLWRERRALRQTPEPPNYLHRAALRLDAILRREGRHVPVYVFGHSHAPEQFPLGRGEDASLYLNSGTWTPTVSSEFEIVGARETFTFVQITRDPATGRVHSRLMVWNDNAGREDILPLLAT